MVPIFDNVEKVIVVPGEAAGGCMPVVGGMFAILFWIAVIAALMDGCSKKSGQTQVPAQRQGESARPRSEPRPQVQAPSVLREAPRRLELKFVAVGPPTFPLADPRPVFRGRSRSGSLVFYWRGQDRFVGPRPAQSYVYLCEKPPGMLNWCWKTRPSGHSDAWACRQNSTGLRGWCYYE